MSQEAAEEVAGSFEEWTAKLALDSVVEEAFRRQDVVDALVREGIRIDDARQVLLSSGTLRDRVWIEQERLQRAGEWETSPPARPSAGQVAWLLLAAVFGAGYVSLLFGAWPRMPLPWQVFCLVGLVAVLVLSGHLRRYTIEMTDLAASVRRPSLSLVAETLVRSELAAKAHALSATANLLEQSELSGLLLSTPDAVNPLELADFADRLTSSAADPAARDYELRWHSGCFVLFCATILEFFDDGLTADELGAGLHRLAVAKQQMVLHPRRSWELIADFRKEHFDSAHPAVSPPVDPG